MKIEGENVRGFLMGSMLCVGVVACVGIVTVKHIGRTPHVMSEVHAIGVENYVECVSTNGIDFKSSVGDNWRFNEESGTYSADHGLTYRPFPGDNCAVHELPLLMPNPHETNQQELQTL